MIKQKNIVNIATSYNVWLDDTETIDSKEFYNQSGQIIKIEYYSPRGVLSKIQEWQYGVYGGLDSFITNTIVNNVIEVIRYKKLYTETGYTKTTSKNGDCFETLAVTVSHQDELLHEILTTFNQGIINEIVKTIYSDTTVRFEQQLRNPETKVLESGFIRVDEYQNNKLVSTVYKDKNGEINDVITIDSLGTITTHSKSNVYNIVETNTTLIESFVNEKTSKILFFEDDDLVSDESFVYTPEGRLLSEKLISSNEIREKNNEWHGDKSRTYTEIFFSVAERHSVAYPLPWAQFKRKIWQFNANENVISFKEYNKNGLHSSMRWDYVYW